MCGEGETGREAGSYSPTLSTFCQSQARLDHFLLSEKYSSFIIHCSVLFAGIFQQLERIMKNSSNFSNWPYPSLFHGPILIEGQKKVTTLIYMDLTNHLIFQMNWNPPWWELRVILWSKCWLPCWKQSNISSHKISFQR